ncbi:hypothetical protein [Oscillibacter ruminantium]|uniref:hypothetical protein n=1 Tax=Oscillibacter ruminantium TaxID=1263547 RepID=UPI0033197DFB
MVKQQLKIAGTWYVIAIAAIGMMWRGLEMHFYGEVQPRIVDNYIAIVWSVMGWLAYLLGREHGKEATIEQTKI